MLAIAVNSESVETPIRHDINFVLVVGKVEVEVEVHVGKDGYPNPYHRNTRGLIHLCWRRCKERQDCQEIRRSRKDPKARCSGVDKNHQG